MYLKYVQITHRELLGIHQTGVYSESGHYHFNLTN